MENTLLDEKESTEELLAAERLESYQKGKEEGERLGYDKAIKEMGAYLAMLQTIASKLLEQKKHLLDHLKPELVEFSLVVCEKVIRQELSQPERLAKMIDSHLATATPFLQGDLVKIILAPDDLIVLEDYLGKIQYDKREIKSLRFVPDSSIRRGDCRIETKTGLLNCSISRQLEDLRSKVLRA